MIAATGVDWPFTVGEWATVVIVTTAGLVALILLAAVAWDSWRR